MRGGKRAGAGRKPRSPKGAATVRYEFRLTPEERRKLAYLGGIHWIHYAILKGVVPK